MKVGIACFPTYGGSGIIATELAHLLAKDHELHLVSYDKPVRLEEERGFLFHKVELLHYPLFERVPCCYSLALASKLVEVIKSYELDIVHAHYAVPNALSAYLAQQISASPVKVVTTLHGTDSYLVGQHPSYKAVTQFSLQRSDALTTVSNYLKERTKAEFNISNNIEVIPNFVNHIKFRKLANREHGVICHSSNFRSIKRIPDVIKAFKKISDVIDCKLVLIGNGPERPNAKQLAQNLGVSEKVDFLGNVKNVHEVLGKSSLFLLPSENESFGLAALEAMSCEVPVITSNVGGLKELITEGSDGFRVKVGDVESIAQNSIKVLEDKKLREEMGRNARKKVLSKYTPDKIVPQYEELYNKIMRYL